MILFRLQTLRAGRHITSFFEFLNNKILKNIYFVFWECFVFSIVLCFFYSKEIENAETTNVTV